MNDFLLQMLVGTAGAGAISVVLCKNVAHMAASLIVALSAVAGIFFSLGASFVGATQLMVYVGGTVILLIFGVMLTSMAAKTELKTTPLETILGLATAAVLLLILVFSVGSLEWPDTIPTAALASKMSSFLSVALALAGIRTDNSGGGHSYLLPFEIVSIHLLVVLVASAHLARPKAQVETAKTTD